MPHALIFTEKTSQQNLRDAKSCMATHPPSMGLPEPLKTLPIMSRDTGVLSTCKHSTLPVSITQVTLQLARDDPELSKLVLKRWRSTPSQQSQITTACGLVRAACPAPAEVPETDSHEYVAPACDL